MKRILLLLLITILFLANTTIIFGQNEPDEKNRYAAFGILGGVNFIRNETSIPLILGSKDCGTFKSGESLGYYTGLSGSYPILNNLLFVEGRLIYDYRPGKFSARTSNYEVFNSSTMEYESLDIEHNYETSLTYLTFEVGLRIKPVETIPLNFRLSFDAGNPVFDSKYSNSQTIINPENALFPIGTKQRTIESGDLNSAGTSLGASIGLAYEFELNPGFIVSPEVSYRYGINSVSSDFEWKTILLRLGLHAYWTIGLKGDSRIEEPSEPDYEITEEIKEPVKEEPIVVIEEAVKEETKPIEENIVIIEEPVRDMIETISVSDFNLSETVVTQTYPLLPYLFFDEKSSNLDSKYLTETPKQNFNENELPTNTLDIYYHLLDIIGSRMNKTPSSTVTLIGNSDGREFDDEEQRLRIAYKRAESVSTYLQTNWNIDKSRIKIETRNKPDLLTSEAYEEGFTENRRVEIVSENPELLAPVIHSKFLEFSSSQKSIPVFAKFNDEDIAEWQVTVKDLDDNEIYKSKGYGQPSEQSDIIVNQVLLNDAGKTVSNKGKLILELKVVNSEGKSELKSANMNVNKTENKYEVGRLNLIVFDFDKYDISTLNMNLISNFVKSAIQANSTVSISGGTDLLGEKKYNYQLSRDRAKAAEKYIKSISPNAKITEVKGTGSDELRYDNSLPEGRFYCRTVMIQVSTPIK